MAKLGASKCITPRCKAQALTVAALLLHHIVSHSAALQHDSPDSPVVHSASPTAASKWSLLPSNDDQAPAWERRQSVQKINQMVSAWAPHAAHAWTSYKHKRHKAPR